MSATFLRLVKDKKEAAPTLLKLAGRMTEAIAGRTLVPLLSSPPPPLPRSQRNVAPVHGQGCYGFLQAAVHKDYWIGGDGSTCCHVHHPVDAVSPSLGSRFPLFCNAAVNREKNKQNVANGVFRCTLLAILQQNEKEVVEFPSTCHQFVVTPQLHATSGAHTHKLPSITPSHPLSSELVSPTCLSPAFGSSISF